MNEWLSVEAIAREVAVSRMTIYRLIERGELPHSRIGKSIRIRRQDWLNYLARQRVEGEQG